MKGKTCLGNAHRVLEEFLQPATGTDRPATKEDAIAAEVLNIVLAIDQDPGFLMRGVVKEARDSEIVQEAEVRRLTMKTDPDAIRAATEG